MEKLRIDKADMMIKELENREHSII
jgi:hypothetical protein